MYHCYLLEENRSPTLGRLISRRRRYAGTGSIASVMTKDRSTENNKKRKHYVQRDAEREKEKGTRA